MPAVLISQVNVLWESRFTSAGSNVDVSKDVVVDGNGNVYVTGTSRTNSTNGYDVVTIKYDALGNQLWAATYNGAGNGLDEGRSITIDKNNNVYVAGYTTAAGGNYNYLTIKYNSSGTQQWLATYNGTGNGFDEAYDVAVDTLGNVYVTGGSDYGSQQSNYVTIKYDSNGAQQWATPYNGTGNGIDAATNIFLDDQLNVYVTGHSEGNSTGLDITTVKYNNGGSQQWASRYNNAAVNQFDIPEAIFVDDNYEVYVTGASYGGQATENDFITIKINSGGVQQWATPYNGPSNDEDRAFDLTVDDNGFVYVTGRSKGAGLEAENLIVVKYNSLGGMVWLKSYNGTASGYDDGKKIQLGTSGYLYATGFSAGIGSNNDYLTLKLDTSNGNIEWKARFNGPSNNNDQAFSMSLDATENIYVTGTSKGAGTDQDYSTIKWCQYETDAGNDIQICAGDTAQMNVTTNGGSNFIWTPTTGLSNPNISNPLAFPAVTTTYFVSSQNGVGCTDVDTITITVNSLPSSGITASGSTTFCIGDSVTLTADSSQSYSWSTMDTTQSITVFNSGNYIVIVSDSNGCGQSGQVLVTVNNLPPVSAGPDTSVCFGDSLQIIASGATYYLWNTQSTLNDSTIYNPLVSPSSNTTYWVEGTDGNGCINYDTVDVAVIPSPTASFLQSTDTVYLNVIGNVGFISTSVGATAYNWDFGDMGSSTQQNPNHTYTTPGVYTVILTVTNGQCTDTATSTVWVIQSNGVQNYKANTITKVYPNPANNMLYINTSNNNLEQLLIFNSLGQLVIQQEVSNKTSQIAVNVRQLQNGVYFLKAISATKQSSIRFVVNH